MKNGIFLSLRERISDIRKTTGGIDLRYLFRMAATLLLASALAGAGCVPQKKPVPGAPTREPTISVYHADTGKKEKMKLEKYLAGVVAAEMDPSWPVNALAAQAILARTFTMENIQSGRVKKLRGTDVSTSVEECQAYDPSRINDRVLKAVDITRGMVVTNNGRYIKSWFSACDGGISASAQEGLAYYEAPTPYIRAGVRDGCLAVTVPENRRWRVEVPLSSVRKAVAEVAGRDPGEITSARVVEKGPSGRATKIKFGDVTVSGPDFRLALGNDVMRSTLLNDLYVRGDSLVMEGVGYGHGVGLCQWGARKMAEEGKSPEEIIKFYFKGVEIKKLWP